MMKQNRHLKKRRKFDPAKKTRVVLEGLSKHVSVTELCRRERISLGRYYCWQKVFIEAGKKAFFRKRTYESKICIPDAKYIARETPSDYTPIIDGLGSTSDYSELTLPKLNLLRPVWLMK